MLYGVIDVCLFCFVFVFASNQQWTFDRMTCFGPGWSYWLYFRPQCHFVSLIVNHRAYSLPFIKLQLAFVGKLSMSVDLDMRHSRGCCWASGRNNISIKPIMTPSVSWTSVLDVNCRKAAIFSLVLNDIHRLFKIINGHRNSEEKKSYLT